MLIDDVINSSELRPDLEAMDLDLKALNKAFVIRCQNAKEFLFANFGEKRSPTMSDFPNVAPTADYEWFEWEHDNLPVLSTQTDESRTSKGTFGVFLESVDLERCGDDLRAYYKLHFQQQGTELTNVRWIAKAFFFTRLCEPGKNVVFPGAMGWFVDPNGSLMLPNPTGFAAFINPRLTDRFREPVQHILMTSAEICWMALSLMHCKNVRTEKGPAHPFKLQRARQKRGRHPLMRWHTLVVDSVRKGADSSTSPSGQGISPSLHMCRGHFKDFTEKGLFGKYHERYWWPMHLKGSARQGIVCKDYEVKSNQIPEIVSAPAEEAVV